MALRALKRVEDLRMRRVRIRFRQPNDTARVGGWTFRFFAFNCIRNVPLAKRQLTLL